jgi:CheY-like chemotaxis protein
MDKSRLEAIRGLDVLVVDDDPDAQEVLCALLEFHGARVTCASSAAQALQYIAEGYTYQVVVSDLAMPERDGVWLIGQLRREALRQNRRILAIVLTGSVLPEIQQEALSAGFDTFLKKPVELDDLLEAVARYRRD